MGFYDGSNCHACGDYLFMVPRQNIIDGYPYCDGCAANLVGRS